MPSSLATTPEAPQLLELERDILGSKLRHFIAGYETPEGTYIPGAWSVVEPARPFVPSWHIDAMCDSLEAVTSGDIRRLIINVPPGHMKSLTGCVFWVAWEWTRKPETRWLCASYSQQFATRDSRRTRTLVESPWYQERWGDRVLIQGEGGEDRVHVPGVEITHDQNLKTRFETTAGGYRIAASVGTDPTGERADKAVLDDPHKIREAHSELKRQAVHEFHDLVISSRFANPKTGVKVIIMQRVHEDDLVGHVLEQDTGWEVLCLPAEYEPKHPFAWPDDPRTEPEELLWPELYDREEIDKLKREFGAYGAATLLQQRPAPAEGGILKRGLWRYYDSAMVEGPWTMDVPEFIVSSWDTALKAKTTNDFTVGQVWAFRGANRYLLRTVRGRWSLPETKREVRELAAWVELKFPGLPHSILVENAANGPEVVAELRDQVGGLLAITPEQDKVSRAHACTPAHEAGNIFVPGRPAADGSGPDTARTPVEVLDFVHECGVFPNGEYDDQVDAFTMAMLRYRASLPPPPKREDSGRPRDRGMLSAGLYDRQF